MVVARCDRNTGWPATIAAPSGESGVGSAARVFDISGQVRHVVRSRRQVHHVPEHGGTCRRSHRRAMERFAKHSPVRAIGAPAQPWEFFRDDESAKLRQQYGLDAELARHLVNRYGTRARWLVSEFGDSTESRAQIRPEDPDVPAEFAFQRAHEMAMLPID